MNSDVLTTRAADGIAVITLGSAKRIYFDEEEMGDALHRGAGRIRGRRQSSRCRRDWRRTGFIYSSLSIAALIRLAESLRASGREWPDERDLQRGIPGQGDRAVREHAKTCNRRHFRHSPGRWIRGSRSPAIFVSLRMGAT